MHRIKVAAALASLATVSFLILSLCSLYWPVIELKENDHEKRVRRFALVATVTQVLMMVLLIIPSFLVKQKCLESLDSCRAMLEMKLLQIGCIGLAMIGLGVTFNSILSIELSTASTTNNSLPCVSSSAFFIAMGTFILLLAALSLMICFWPAVSVPMPPQEQLQTYQVSSLLEPLLIESTVSDSDETSQDVEQPNSELGNELAIITPIASTSRSQGARRLLSLAAPEVLYLYAGCAVLLLRLPFSLSIPHFVSSTLSAVAKNDFARAESEILLLLIAGSIDAVLDFWCVFLFGFANQRIVKTVRLGLFQHLVRQEIAFFDRTNSGELNSRLQSDCSEMAADLTWFFRFSIESIVRIVGITTYMMLRSPRLGAVALSIAPVVALINKVYGHWLQHNAARVQDALALANAVAQQALGNIRTVVACGGERLESERYADKIECHYQLNLQQLYMTGLYYMIVSTFLMNTVVQGLILYIGSRLIQIQEIAPDVLLAFMLYQNQLQNETLNLFKSYTSLLKSSGAGDKVFQLLDRRPPPPSIRNEHVLANEEEDDNDDIDVDTVEKVDDDTETQWQGKDVESDEQSLVLNKCQSNDSLVLTVDPPLNFKSLYHIDFRNVTFSYPNRPHNIVVKNLNLCIPHGQIVALVGRSGAGKSTIVHLLQRFYEPNAGAIFVNGTDLRRMDLLWHRRQIGTVTQDPVLFEGSLLDNLRYGHKNIAFERVQEAARLAHADEFIQEFPAKYDTQVGERGAQLSGGQKQRIALGRAFLQTKSLLLLDEATSALDHESEERVQQALDQLLERHERSTTTIIIAHRLKTIRNADRIVVMEKGCIVEEGSHEELMQQDRRHNGVYRKMVERAGSSGNLSET